MNWLKKRRKEKKKQERLEKKILAKVEKKQRRKNGGEARKFTSTFGSTIDFTLLDPRTTVSDIQELLSIAGKNEYYTVVVPPVFVRYAKSYSAEHFSGAVSICSVVGFPLGNTTTKGKIQETKSLVRDGVDEIDVCANISMIKMGEFNALRSELRSIKRAARGRVVKVILETCFLTDAEIEKTVKMAIRAKADYVMTSTGYAPVGATIEVIEKLNTYADGKIKIKASGGIKTKMEAESFLRLGAKRIGTSRIL